MITPLEKITLEDYLLFKKHRRKSDGYTKTDIAEVDMLLRKYINIHHTGCSGCGSGTLHAAKYELAIYLANGEERIIAAIKKQEENQKPKEVQIDVVVEPINPNKNNRNRKNK